MYNSVSIHDQNCFTIKSKRKDFDLDTKRKDMFFLIHPLVGEKIKYGNKNYR